MEREMNIYFINRLWSPSIINQKNNATFDSNFWDLGILYTKLLIAMYWETRDHEVSTSYNG